MCPKVRGVGRDLPESPLGLGWRVHGLGLLDRSSVDPSVVEGVLSLVESDVVDEEVGNDRGEDGDDRRPDAEVLHHVRVGDDGSLSDGRVGVVRGDVGDTTVKLGEQGGVGRRDIGGESLGHL